MAALQKRKKIREPHGEIPGTPVFSVNHRGKRAAAERGGFFHGFLQTKPLCAVDLQIEPGEVGCGPAQLFDLMAAPGVLFTRVQGHRPRSFRRNAVVSSQLSVKRERKRGHL